MGHIAYRELVDTLLYAFEKGINFVDTTLLMDKDEVGRLMGKC